MVDRMTHASERTPAELAREAARVIAELTGVDVPDCRAALQAILLAGVVQGAQIHRIHDVPGARQALALWRAVTEGYQP